MERVNLYKKRWQWRRARNIEAHTLHELPLLERDISPLELGPAAASYEMCCGDDIVRVLDGYNGPQCLENDGMGSSLRFLLLVGTHCAPKDGGRGDLSVGDAVPVIELGPGARELEVAACGAVGAARPERPRERVGRGPKVHPIQRAEHDAVQVLMEHVSLRAEDGDLKPVGRPCVIE